MNRFRAVAALLAVLWPLAACDEEGEGDLKVMTQNLYFGFDVGPLLSSENPEEIPLLAAQALLQLQATKFPERAAAIADRIAAVKPHLVGLQEVALYRIQSPGDAVAGGTEPAVHVLADHLEILLAALGARGLDYRVAGKVQNIDVELPALAGVEPLAFDDVRLTDFDVVLARGDVAVSAVVSANFAAKLPLANLGLEVPRGYVALDAAWGGRTVRFVNTHLEDLPFEELQLAQAEELAASLAAETKPVVLVGDFNSPAPSGATCDFLASQGYVDAWTRNVRKDEGEGLTWGHGPLLDDPTDVLTLRIDLVFVRAGAAARFGSVAAEVWGDQPSERTESGLWPSDHAGVSAWLEFLPPRRGSK
jgi:endonuclease/exonuclease/phosphatase family metal-dependent hydrolase